MPERHFYFVSNFSIIKINFTYDNTYFRLLFLRFTCIEKQSVAYDAKVGSRLVISSIIYSLFHVLVAVNSQIGIVIGSQYRQYQTIGAQ